MCELKATKILKAQNISLRFLSYFLESVNMGYTISEALEFIHQEIFYENR